MPLLRDFISWLSTRTARHATDRPYRDASQASRVASSPETLEEALERPPI
jgi:hypothetical protein